MTDLLSIERSLSECNLSDAGRIMEDAKDIRMFLSNHQSAVTMQTKAMCIRVAWLHGPVAGAALYRSLTGRTTW